MFRNHVRARLLVVRRLSYFLSSPWIDRRCLNSCKCQGFSCQTLILSLKTCKDIDLGLLSLVLCVFCFFPPGWDDNTPAVPGSLRFPLWQLLRLCSGSMFAPIREKRRTRSPGLVGLVATLHGVWHVAGLSSGRCLLTKGL